MTGVYKRESIDEENVSAKQSKEKKKARISKPHEHQSGSEDIGEPSPQAADETDRLVADARGPSPKVAEAV